LTFGVVVGLGLLSWLAGWSTLAGFGSSGVLADEDQIRVALVTDAGGLHDESFNQLAYRGLTRAAEKLDVRASVTESKSFADYIPNLTKYAARNYDLVIAVGFTMSSAVGTVSGQFPNVHFALIDAIPTDANGNPVNRANVEGVLFKEQESGCCGGSSTGRSRRPNEPPGTRT
jgi:basic membrane protein A